MGCYGTTKKGCYGIAWQSAACLRSVELRTDVCVHLSFSAFTSRVKANHGFCSQVEVFETFTLMTGPERCREILISLFPNERLPCSHSEKHSTVHRFVHIAHFIYDLGSFAVEVPAEVDKLSDSSACSSTALQ